MIVGQELGWPTHDGRVTDFRLVSVESNVYDCALLKSKVEEEEIVLRINKPIDGFTSFTYKFDAETFCSLFNYDLNKISRLQKGQLFVVDESYRIFVDVNVNKLPYIAVAFKKADKYMVAIKMKSMMFVTKETEDEATERIGLSKIRNKRK